MHGLLHKLKFHGDPFEHLSAENEKEIDKYAVRPPYFEQTFSKSMGAKSFILFGYRGSGKSATRVTVYKKIWEAQQKGEKTPLPVNLIDFDSITKEGLGKVTLRKFVDEACFKAIESIFAWLAALPEDSRSIFIDGLRKDEQDLVITMVKSFYLNRPELSRGMSAENALKLLDQAWHNRAAFWIEKRWSTIAKLISSLANGLAKEQIGTNGEQTESLYELLYSKESSDEQSSMVVLSRLVEMARLFGFSGISFLIDKIDETDKTSSSVENSTELIYPLLSNIKVFEIEGLGWILFLWDQIQSKLQQPERQVRLDKIQNAKVDWKCDELIELLEARLQYFSYKLHHFNTISDIANPSQTVDELIRLSTISPRELVRLMAIIIREHNLRYNDSNSMTLLITESFEHGMNLYASEAAVSRYGDQMVRQIARIKRVVSRIFCKSSMVDGSR